MNEKSKEQAFRDGYMKAKARYDAAVAAADARLEADRSTSAWGRKDAVDMHSYELKITKDSFDADVKALRYEYGPSVNPATLALAGVGAVLASPFLAAIGAAMLASKVVEKLQK